MRSRSLSVPPKCSTPPGFHWRQLFVIHLASLCFCFQRSTFRGLSCICTGLLELFCLKAQRGQELMSWLSSTGYEHPAPLLRYNFFSRTPLWDQDEAETLPKITSLLASVFLILHSPQSYNFSWQPFLHKSPANKPSSGSGKSDGRHWILQGSQEFLLVSVFSFVALDLYEWTM